MSVCFGRAPAPQCRSKLQLGHRSPTVHPLSTGLGQGWGRWITDYAELHPRPHCVCNAWLFFGCSVVPWVGILAERARGGYLSGSGALQAGPWSGAAPICGSTLVSAPGPSGFFSPLLLLCGWAEFPKRASWRPVYAKPRHSLSRARKGPSITLLLLLSAAPPLPPLPPVPPPGLQSLLVQLLQQRVAFGLGRPDAVCTHDTGGPVAVEHQDQLLPLKLQLLYLGL